MMDPHDFGSTCPSLAGAAATAVKPGAVLAMAGGVTAAGRRWTSAAARHGAWTLAVGVAVAVPVVAAVAPAWPVAVLRVPPRPTVTRVDVPPTALPTAGGAEVDQRTPGPPVGPAGVPSADALPMPPAARRPVDWAAVVATVWAAGAVLVASGGAVGLIAANRLVGSAVPVESGPVADLARAAAAEVGVRRRVRVRAGGRVTTPLTAGVFRPVVLLPAAALAWPADQLRPVLLHELAHVKRHDCATGWLALACTAIQGFDPLAWVAAARLRAERERACDDAVGSSAVRRPPGAGGGAVPAGVPHAGVTAGRGRRRSSVLRWFPFHRRFDMRGMRSTVWAACLIGALAVSARGDGDGAAAEAVSVRTAEPVVVKATPQAGTDDVDAAATTEIKVVFSKDMADHSWSWSTLGEENFPETTGKPHYEADHRTCVLPVKLKAGKTYAIWLNSSKFTNFRDEAGRPAVPYLLVFATKP